jgi:RNA polymerase sigma-70 factor (ECF subfamily)
MSSSAARYFPGEFRKAVTSIGAEVKPLQTLPSEATTVHDCDQQSSIFVSGSANADSLTSLVASSDEVLMACVVDGSKDALACLFHRYARLVRAVGYKILRDDSEADDLLQDVFLFIHQKSGVFDSSKSPARSWIVQMAYQRAIDRRRYLNSRHFYSQVDLEDVGNELSASGARSERYENSIEEVLGRVGLRKVFGVLSEVQRQTLGLYLLDGYTFEEIAVKLDQTRGNVKHHYFRGLEKLRKQIFSCNRQGK